MSLKETAYDFKRYDNSDDRSLKPFSAADEYLINAIGALQEEPVSVAVYNDRFGYLTCQLSAYKLSVFISYKSQQKAIEQNLIDNRLPAPEFVNLLSKPSEKFNCAIIKIPKSLALFELCLNEIVLNAAKDVVVLCGFMTRHFTPKMIEIAQKYFENVDQSQAVKKSRVMTLRNRKDVVSQNLMDIISYNNNTYKQYWGVFSAKHIDYATQYLLENIEVKKNTQRILDLASGNGVIASEIKLKVPHAEFHLVDDSILAVASAKINITGENVFHHCNNNLAEFEDNYFDLIVTNPPFHFEYEVNINISIALFKQCQRCLSPSGHLQIVSNKHLNYKTHLDRIFSKVDILCSNEKFVIYKCSK